VVAILRDILSVAIAGNLHCVYHHPTLNVVLSLTKQRKKFL
jgi:hypothetical protein